MALDRSAACQVSLSTLTGLEERPRLYRDSEALPESELDTLKTRDRIGIQVADGQATAYYEVVAPPVGRAMRLIRVDARGRRLSGVSEESWSFAALREVSGDVAPPAGEEWLVFDATSGPGLAPIALALGWNVVISENHEAIQDSIRTFLKAVPNPRGKQCVVVPGKDLALFLADKMWRSVVTADGLGFPRRLGLPDQYQFPGLVLDAIQRTDEFLAAIGV